MTPFARLARLKTITPTSLLRNVLVLGVLAVLVTLTGCRNLPDYFGNGSGGNDHRQSAQTSTTPAPDAAEKQAVLDAVSRYLNALIARDYATAYDLLSGDSQSKHAKVSFEKQATKGEMPSYDLKAMRVLELTGDHALVEAPLQDDPATHGFHLVREQGTWKVVYWGGTPGSPDAEP